MFSVTYAMDGVIFGWPEGRPSLPTEMMPVACHSTFGIATNPTSDSHSFLHQGPSGAVDDSSVDRRLGPLDIPPHSHDLQVNTEVRFPAELPRTHGSMVSSNTNIQTHPSSLPPSISATHTCGVDEGARTLRLEGNITNILDEISYVENPPDTIFRPGLASFAQLETPMHSNEVPLVVSNDSLTYIYIDNGDVDATLNCLQEGESMNVPSVQGYQYATSTSSNSEPSIPPGISCASVIRVVQYKEQRASRGLLQQLPKQVKGRGPAASSSRSSRRPAGTRGPLNGPYLCNVCGKPYKQQQGVLRHHREKHDPELCNYCGIFKWGRPYLYKKHLQKKHSGVNLDGALDKATDAGRMY
ncbi:hypothetical protein BC827DRAFT_1293823 [Russula dissimulans]|nr:hypothetical protein BC827DRAFT_1293823 [Russula dissimulans]